METVSITLYSWAQRHGVSREALQELVQYVAPPVKVEQGQSEAAVTAAVRLEASRVGCRLFRNNVGCCTDETGRLIRYGLMNESAQMNKTIKSSDLIGIRPILVGPQHLGTTIGQFVAREVKAGSWVWGGTEREVAQMRFIDMVNSLGGDAAMVNGVGSL